MMGNSFLHLMCTVHENIEVTDTISKLSGVMESISVTGVYDCIVKTENMTRDDVDSLVLTSIHPIDYVCNVLAMHDASKLLVAKNV